MLPKQEKVGLEWATFQVLRKTRASRLSKKALHAQKRRGATLAQAEETEAIPFPFHADQQFVAQPSGKVLCSDYGTNDSQRGLRCR